MLHDFTPDYLTLAAQAFNSTRLRRSFLVYYTSLLRT